MKHRKHRCPTCGTHCEVYSSDDGTNGFISADTVIAALVELLERIDREYQLNEIQDEIHGLINTHRKVENNETNHN